MNILISTNKKFLEASRTMLISLEASNKEEKLNVFLFYSELNKNDILRLSSVIAKHGNTFHPILVDDSCFAGIPINLLSKETYYRLLAVKLLPDRIDKILYLDSDMVITGKLNELYETDLNGYFYAAAPDTSNGVNDLCMLLHIPSKYTYINAGVLLMNLAELRKKFNLEEALDFAKKNPHLVPNCDQDVINGLYYDKIKIIDGKYDYEARFHSFLEVVTYPFEWIKNKKNKNIVIVHYMGKDKPWHKGYWGKYGFEFYKNARYTFFNKYSFYNFVTWPVYIFKILTSK